MGRLGLSVATLRLLLDKQWTPAPAETRSAGAHLTAMGCMLAIRNPATHETGDGNPITCAEQLATLSMVARWVRNWILERYIEPIDTTTSPVLPAAYQELLRQQRAAVQLPQQQRSALPQGTPAGSPTAD